MLQCLHHVFPHPRRPRYHAALDQWSIARGEDPLQRDAEIHHQIGLNIRMRLRAADTAEDRTGQRDGAVSHRRVVETVWIGGTDGGADRWRSRVLGRAAGLNDVARDGMTVCGYFSDD